MLERLIKRVLDAAIENLKDEPSRYRVFFKNQNRLTDDEVDKLLADFQASPPETLVHYPRVEGNFPLYSIIMANEKEWQPGMFLGDYGGLLSPEEAECLGNIGMDGAEHLSSMFLREYHITTYALNPDVAIAMYELSKYFLFREKPTFNASGVMNTSLSGGDLAPLVKSEFGPDCIFRRRLVFQAAEMYEVIGDLLPKIREIDGAHWGGGSTEPPPGVKTQITTYDPNEVVEE